MSKTSPDRVLKSETCVSDKPPRQRVFIPEFSCFEPHLGYSDIAPVCFECKAINLPPPNICKDIIRPPAVDLERDASGHEVSVKVRVLPAPPACSGGSYSGLPHSALLQPGSSTASSSAAHLIYAVPTPAQSSRGRARVVKPSKLHPSVKQGVQLPAHLDAHVPVPASVPTLDAPNTISPHLLHGQGHETIAFDNWHEQESSIYYDTSLSFDDSIHMETYDSQLSIFNFDTELTAEPEFVRCPSLEGGSFDTVQDDLVSPFDSPEDTEEISDDNWQVHHDLPDQMPTKSFGEIIHRAAEQSLDVLSNNVGIMEEQRFFQNAAASLPQLGPAPWHKTLTRLGIYAHGTEEELELDIKAGIKARVDDINAPIVNAPTTVHSTEPAAGPAAQSATETVNDAMPETDTLADTALDSTPSSRPGADPPQDRRLKTSGNPVLTSLKKRTVPNNALLVLFSTKELTVGAMQHLKRRHILRKRKRRSKDIRRIVAELGTTTRNPVACCFANCVCTHIGVHWESSMAAHITAAHVKSKTLSCHICVKDYSRSDALLRHMRAAHRESARQICNQMEELAYNEYDPEPSLRAQWKCVQDFLQPPSDYDFII